MGLGFLLFPLRIVQFITSVIVLALSAYVAHWYNHDTLTASPTQVNFLVFVPAFSLLSMIYLELSQRVFTKTSHPIAHFVVQLLNTLFYFAGFVALAVFLSKLLFCRGTVCVAARADAAFAAFSWVIWTITTVSLALEVFGRRATSSSTGLKPNMSEA